MEEVNYLLQLDKLLDVCNERSIRCYRNPCDTNTIPMINKSPHRTLSSLGEETDSDSGPSFLASFTDLIMNHDPHGGGGREGGDFQNNVNNHASPLESGLVVPPSNTLGRNWRFLIHLLTS